MARGLERLNEPLHFKRLELIGKLKENRAKHIIAYEDAMPVWKQEMCNALVELAEEIAVPEDGFANIDFSTITDLRNAKPFCNTDDYDRAIAMLQMATELEIKLDTEAFRQLVLDEWDWKNRFRDHVVSYAAKSPRRL